MKENDIAAVRAQLEGFVEDVFASLPRADQRLTGSLYLRGLMLDGKRKSMQPMAERLGVDFQQLPQFVSSSPWKIEPVRRAIATRATATINWRLFIPESWDDTCADADEDAVRIQARRERSKLPDTARNQTKWSMGLEMVDQLISWDLAPPALVGDAGYGNATGFRLGLTERNIPYVLAVTFSTTAHTENARPETTTARPRLARYRTTPPSLKELALNARAEATPTRPVEERDENESREPGREHGI